MTKANEIAKLEEFTASIPRDSYLRPWLEDVLPQVRADIHNDFCVSPSVTETRQRAETILTEATRQAAEIVAKAKTFQDLILTLQNYWAAQGCLILQPYDVEMGAGTFHPATTLRALGPKPWRAAYVQPSRRPKDGRYGENPNRFGKYYQYQVIIKPAPQDIQLKYLGSLKALGLDPREHDIRWIEDDWESPTLGAWGLGWEVWCPASLWQRLSIR